MDPKRSPENESKLKRLHEEDKENFDPRKVKIEMVDESPGLEMFRIPECTPLANGRGEVKQEAQKEFCSVFDSTPSPSPTSSKSSSPSNFGSTNFCHRCKRYGHIKPYCRNAFNYRYPQRYLDEHPGFQQKLRMAARERRKQKEMNWQLRSEGNNPLEKSDNYYNRMVLRSQQPDALHMNKIIEAVNQILFNQLEIMKKPQSQVSCENCQNKSECVERNWNPFRNQHHSNRYYNYKGNSYRYDRKYRR